MVGDQWSPALNVVRVLDTLRRMLESQNPEDMLNMKAADLHRRSKERFEEKARLMTQKHALIKGSPEAMEIEKRLEYPS